MRIEHISDVLPAIDGRDDFVVIEKDGYTVIDYVYQDKDTFDDPIRLECRGIKFDGDGAIIARPFRKFFNVGEKEQPSEIDLSRPHRILEKLDGSMIHPALVGGSIVLMTRKGVTDVANKAAKGFLSQPTYFRMMNRWLRNGFTPIFEFTAPDNRIVIRYDHPALTLLAIREVKTGEYLPSREARQAAELDSIPYVGEAPLRSYAIDDILDHTRGLIDQEGYVIHFDDGHMLKMKAEDYVLKHRALDDLSSKKKVLALVLQGFEDDVLPMLDEADAHELREFAASVNERVVTAARTVETLLAENEGLTRKDFALGVAAAQPDYLRPALFGGLDGKNINAILRQVFEKNPEHVDVQWRGE